MSKGVKTFSLTEIFWEVKIYEKLLIKYEKYQIPNTKYQIDYIFSILF